MHTENIGICSWGARLIAVAFVAGAIGCSGGSSDDNGSGGTGGGTTGTGGSSGSGMTKLTELPSQNTDCPDTSPPPTEQYGACCMRALTSCEAPAFRISAMSFTKPATMADPFIAGIIAESFDDDRMNWVVALEGAEDDGPLTVTTGHADRNSDGSFQFTSGAASAPGDPTRWDPRTVPGTITGEQWSSEATDETVAVPVLNQQRDGHMIEIPFRRLRFETAQLSVGRQCIGERRITSFTTDAGSVRAFLDVDETIGALVMITPALQFTLCSLLAGTNPMDCADVPRSMWQKPPDSLCDGTDCTEGGCDPVTECNAWALEGGFGAQAVELVTP